MKDKFMKLVTNLANRLKEPSSWAAIAATLASLGIVIDGGLWQTISLAGSGVAGLIALLRKEQGKAPEEKSDG